MGALRIMFHNLLYVKDFYSHSNWVELGNKAPYSTLIRPDQPLENLAGRILLSALTQQLDDKHSPCGDLQSLAHTIFQHLGQPFNIPTALSISEFKHDSSLI